MSAHFDVIEPSGGPQLPLVMHLPHSATTVPSPWRERIILSDEELERELLLMTDRYTDELFENSVTSGGLLFVNRGDQRGVVGAHTRIVGSAYHAP